MREIDALDGLMGVAADAAGIQFRLLNRRKGPAVRGPRTQADRKLYRQAMQGLIAAQTGLTVIEGEIAELLAGSGRVRGVRLVRWKGNSLRGSCAYQRRFFGDLSISGEEDDFLRAE